MMLRFVLVRVSFAPSAPAGSGCRSGSECLCVCVCVCVCEGFFSAP